MSDSTLNKWLAEGDDAAEAGFTPDPPASPPDPVGAHVFINTEDPTKPLAKHWDGAAFVQVATPVASVTDLGTGVATFLATPSSANLRGALTDETGAGAAVFADTPTLVTPVLGTPTSGTLTNCTGLPVSTGVSGLGANVATALATPSSANLAAAVTDETGSGALVFGTSPTITTPTISGAIAFPDNVRQTFNPGADAAGLNVGSLAGDPGTPSDGDIWYDSAANELTARINGSNIVLGGAAAAGGSNTEVQYNNAGSLDGITGATSDGTSVTLTSPTFVTPALGTPASGTLTNCAGLPATGQLSSTCMVKNASDLTGQNYTTAAAVTWDTEIIDDNGYHDGGNPSRLTIPSGVARVRVGANVLLRNVSANVNSSISIRKGGSADWDGAAGQDVETAGTTRLMSCQTGVVAVSATEYFEVFITQTTDTSVDVDAERSNFWIEVVS